MSIPGTLSCSMETTVSLLGAGAKDNRVQMNPAPLRVTLHTKKPLPEGSSGSGLYTTHNVFLPSLFTPAGVCKGSLVLLRRDAGVFRQVRPGQAVP